MLKPMCAKLVFARAFSGCYSSLGSVLHIAPLHNSKVCIVLINGLQNQLHANMLCKHNHQYCNQYFLLSNDLHKPIHFLRTSLRHSIVQRDYCNFLLHKTLVAKSLFDSRHYMSDMENDISMGVSLIFFLSNVQFCPFCNRGILLFSQSILLYLHFSFYHLYFHPLSSGVGFLFPKGIPQKLWKHLA